MVLRCMTIHMPPHVVARRLLRTAHQNALTFSRLTRQLFEMIGIAAQGAKDQDTWFRQIVRRHGNFLCEAGGGGHDLSLSSMGATSCGYLVRPFALGQGASESEGVYLEQAMMLLRAEALARRKRLRISEACLPIAFTRHAIERILERAQVEEEAMIPRLLGEAPNLTAALALTLAFDIDVFMQNDRHSTRMVAIPAFDGLLLARVRLVSALKSAPQIGYSVSVSPRDTRQPYLNRDLFLSSAITGLSEDDDTGVFYVWCLTSYLHSSDLRPEQSDYRLAFLDLMQRVGLKEMTRLAGLYFDPENVDPERWERLNLGEQIRSLTGQLQASVRSGWLKAEPRYPVSYLYPFKMKASHFKADFLAEVAASGFEL